MFPFSFPAVGNESQIGLQSHGPNISKLGQDNEKKINKFLSM